MGGNVFQEAPARFTPAVDEGALEQGARNLLEGCAKLRKGQRVLILHEAAHLGWFDREAPMTVAAMAAKMGAEVDLLAVGGPNSRLPQAFEELQRRSDVEIWFARIGDQDRFYARNPDRITVVSYARTARALASDFGLRAHDKMMALKNRIDCDLAQAGQIRVTCPLGTDLAGSQASEGAEDVTIRRFPMCVPRPVSARDFSGRVALKGFLTPTGSRTYEPAAAAFEGVVLAHIDRGRVTGFHGNEDAVARICAHHQHVAELFDIEPFTVHSWHAGIHTGCFSETAPHTNPDLWSNTIFGNPRWLHFHTCGDYAPGEICWMIENPTIEADDRAIWSDGVLTTQDRASQS